MAIVRKKTTVYLDPELLRAAKMLAAGTGRREYEILEDALREYMKRLPLDTGHQALRDLLDQFATRADLEDRGALQLAYEELHEARVARRGN